ELQGHSFARGNSKILVDPEIPLVEIRSAKAVPSQTPEWPVGRWNRKCRLVEISIQHRGTTSACRIADQIRPHHRLTAKVGNASGDIVNCRWRIQHVDRKS